MNLKAIFVLIALILCTTFTGVWAQPGNQGQIRKLETEYRLRLQVHNFMADLALFEEGGMLGRSLAVTRLAEDIIPPKGRGDSEPLVGEDVQVSVTTAVLAGVERSLGENRVLLDGRPELDQIRREIQLLKAAKNEKQTGQMEDQ